jgi:hypothetical protein
LQEKAETRPLIKKYGWKEYEVTEHDSALMASASDEDRLLYENTYDGRDGLIDCQVCATQFIETFETDACPGCGTEEY